MPVLTLRGVETLALALAVGFATGPARPDALSGAAQQTVGEVRDSASPQDSIAAGLPAEVAEALRISESLTVLRDSIELFLLRQATLRGPELQVERFRGRDWLIEAAGLQESMVALLPEVPELASIEAAGIVGKVRSMGLADTTPITFDNRKLSVPDSPLWSTVIGNRSPQPTRRAEAVVRVGFDQDVSAVSEILLGGLQAIRQGRAGDLPGRGAPALPAARHRPTTAQFQLHPTLRP